MLFRSVSEYITTMTMAMVIVTMKRDVMSRDVIIDAGARHVGSGGSSHQGSGGDACEGCTLSC